MNKEELYNLIELLVAFSDDIVEFELEEAVAMIMEAAYSELIEIESKLEELEDRDPDLLEAMSFKELSELE